MMEARFPDRASFLGPMTHLRDYAFLRFAQVKRALHRCAEELRVVTLHPQGKAFSSGAGRFQEYCFHANGT
jgi:hypothetical protein